ncbi:MAG TPA: hypothetical protein VK762_09910, partial [Polyangiaceae bacterium]|nr:hypothetical protein [Polyangiaceae bacterium]
VPLEDVPLLLPLLDVVPLDDFPPPLELLLLVAEPPLDALPPPLDVDVPASSLAGLSVPLRLPSFGATVGSVPP